MQKTRPIHEIRLGRVKAAIWANELDGRIRHSVTISRLYKDGDNWKSSDSFGREELPLACKVLDMAHSWIYQQPGEANERQPEAPEATKGRQVPAAGSPRPQ